VADTAVLPLFPLGHVLMPGCPLPLRIFEPRYRQLLDDITGADGAREFGVVMLTTGSEVALAADDRPPRFADVGTVAQVLEVHPNPNGTFSVLTGGGRRFRVVRVVDTEAPYLMAEVSFLAEVAGQVPAGLPDAGRALAAEYARIITALTGSDPRSADPYPSDPVLLSYRLATEAPLTPADHQELLEDDTAAARLLHVQRVLRREVMLLRRTRSIAVSPGLLWMILRSA
jgi:Lon protease-like protein